MLRLRSVSAKRLMDLPAMYPLKASTLSFPFIKSNSSGIFFQTFVKYSFKLLTFPLIIGFSTSSVTLAQKMLT